MYGKPRAVTEKIVAHQNTYISICFALQLLGTFVVCFTAYQVTTPPTTH